MDDLKLAALMCSKVCHDLISPVGALSNGIEVLTEDDDPEMREHAMALLQSSADQAAAKLKFARLAYGASGSRGTEIDLREVESAIKELHGGGKISILWDAPGVAVDKDVVKVLANLTHIACDTIPRGGEMAVSVAIDDGSIEARIRTEGVKARVADEILAGLAGNIALDDLDARSILPHICGVLSRGFGNGIEVAAEGECVNFSFTYRS